jgi:predicted ribosome quality control (RQC) complex YloA/Tae2 family protein
LVFDVDACITHIDLFFPVHSSEKMKHVLCYTHRNYALEMKSFIIDTESAQYTFKVGQSDVENEVLIKSSEQNDMWFHFKGVSGPHGVLATAGVDIEKRYLYECANYLLDCKSKVSRKTPIIYTQIKHVAITGKKRGQVTVQHEQTLKM